MASLFERYRPKMWSEVVGQDKLVAKVNALRPRGLGGRAYWIAGPSGAGKTTCGRFVAKNAAWLSGATTARRLRVSQLVASHDVHDSASHESSGLGNRHQR
jgi:DNA polymerase III gamma/tau subunit